MEFQWPFMLWLLLLVPVFIIVYIQAQRRRQRDAIRYTTLPLDKKGPGISRHIPSLLFLLGLTIILVALARPFAMVEVPSKEGTILLTMDTSGSMQADDIKPTRMEAVKTAAIAFVKHQSSTARIGVVSFSDNAFLVQSPTTDQHAVLAAISRLHPQSGTAIGSGLLVSLSAIPELSGLDLLRELDPSAADLWALSKLGKEDYRLNPPPGLNKTLSPTPTPVPLGIYTPAIIILLTDGENNEGLNPMDVARQAAKFGVRIYTVGIGSPRGSLVHVQGHTILTQLDEDTLKQIAETANGAYYNAMSNTDLETIYNNLGTRLAFKTERIEITADLTGLAAAFFFIAGILSLLLFNRLP